MFLITPILPELQDFGVESDGDSKHQEMRSPRKMVSYSDTLISYPCYYDHKSHVPPTDDGFSSFYIKELCGVLREWAKDLELADMLNILSHRLESKNIQNN